MGDYTKERCTNFMRIPITGAVGNMGLYYYQKLVLNNCKVTFADGSIYLEKVITNDKFLSIKDEPNKLYLDDPCTVLANVT
ncbi:hypothetical protein [Bacillus mycoides]|uniref:hypothetical protein n=1 Tax=Bacillus mycoides TaxID=1405 RepID=UPI002E23E621|nr:hypothetical protein [Bacillus mycoides]